MPFAKGTYHHTEKAKESISINNARIWLGKHLPAQARKKMSLAKKRNPVRYWLGKHLPKGVAEKFRKANLGKKLSEDTKRKISRTLSRKLMESEELRRKWSECKRGAKSTLWRGGIYPKNLADRKGVEYRLWREAVYARDGWTCQKCQKRGGRLVAHHVKGFAKYPELRFAIDNGITLCVVCHKSVHLRRR